MNAHTTPVQRTVMDTAREIVRETDRLAEMRRDTIADDWNAAREARSAQYFEETKA